MGNFTWKGWQTSAEDAPQPTSILCGKNLRTSAEGANLIFEPSEQEIERLRQKLKALIKLGKDRGYLTHAEINDHLPENIIDTDAIEGIICTLRDMGIAVLESDL